MGESQHDTYHTVTTTRSCHLYLSRYETSIEHGCFGTISSKRIEKTDGHQSIFEDAWFTLEPPIDEPEFPAIPEGLYVCERWVSKQFGRTWIICDVPNRSGILFHALNWYREPFKGFRETRGCIGLGKEKTVILEKPAIGKSKLAMKEFMFHTLGLEKLTIEIKNNFSEQKL